MREDWHFSCKIRLWHLQCTHLCKVVLFVHRLKGMGWTYITYKKLTHQLFPFNRGNKQRTTWKIGTLKINKNSWARKEERDRLCPFSCLKTYNTLQKIHLHYLHTSPKKWKQLEFISKWKQYFCWRKEMKSNRAEGEQQCMLYWIYPDDWSSVEIALTAKSINSIWKWEQIRETL